ncbi:tetratricopeptide repeat protein [Flagellimonas baculiformis]|uniref:tetratricopeptide repeat protein n=1 Tax=Flagellimonas baculiformis TaxID=3067310 RepID=UPI00296F2894|nr:tetratricopeptide repeat protein [Muricauda sp. D6]
MAVDKILSNVGLFRNFIIKECPNIENAIAATVMSSLGSLERYIIYDKAFLQRVIGATNSDWSATSILAHEIGHHLNGHTLISGIDNHDSELQADEFSGFVLAKMGATLDESLRAMNKLGSEYSSSSHPSKSKRIKAISDGWKKANGGKIEVDYEDGIELYLYNETLMAEYVNKAVDENKRGNYEYAAGLLVKAFQFSAGLEKIYLYYAASSYVNAGNYEKALKYYLLLLKNGIVTLEKQQQNEIYKNIALIYQQLGETDKAIASYDEAILANPRDVNLILGKANLYYSLGDKDKFKQLMKKASGIDSNNPDLAYNIGVINSEQGNYQEAKDAYKKAIRIAPDYINAYLNLSTVYVNQGNLLVDEMNKLGNSKADIAQYDEFKTQKDAFFKLGAKVLEDCLIANPNNSSRHNVITQLKYIYGALGDKKNYDRVKKM